MQLKKTNLWKVFFIDYKKQITDKPVEEGKKTPEIKKRIIKYFLVDNHSLKKIKF